MNRGTGETSKRSLFLRYAIDPLVFCLQSTIRNFYCCLLPVSAESAKGRISPKLNG
jgi:hypothetical protein